MEIPDGDEFLIAFGVEPAPSVLDADVYEMRLPVGELTAIFSYSEGGESIRVCWERENSPLMEAFREGVEVVSIRDAEGRSGISCLSRMGPFVGILDIGIYPSLSIKDSILLEGSE
ncbi:hypothetical protein [Streptomyces sp. NPDC048425]|uniref:hypothetical protein n=1 Tax=Streptomyces sp. NPDC048425 TaxID=3365548 RepID=UPI00371E75AF